MQNERIWTVYMHTVPNGKKYIGITSKRPADRWGKDGAGYDKQMFMNAINRYGWDNIEHKILFTNLTQLEANCKEKFLIRYYRTTDRDYGYNRSFGGDKTTKGLKYSEEAKEKIREKARSRMKKVYQYTLDGRFVAEYESVKSAVKCSGIKHISSACNGTVRSAGGFIWKYTFEEQVKLKDNNAYKRVYQYDLDGKFIAEYESIAMASKETKIGVSSISMCCKGMKESVKGYMWSYQMTDMEPCNNVKNKVYQYDLEGNFIQAYLSVSDAALKTGFHRNGIYNVCSGKRRYANGYIWSYEFSDSIKMRDHKLSKDVYQYSLNKKFITQYSSIKEAADVVGVHKSDIQACCSGRQKTAKGFIWSYTKLN